MLQYQIKLDRDDNGTLMVTCPALPEVTSFGDDESDALKHAASAIEEAISARIADGQDIPVPRLGKKPKHVVTLPAMAALKVQLYNGLRAQGHTRAELMRKLKWNRESVDRLFRIDHASRLDQMEAAFGALNQCLDVRVVSKQDEDRTAA